MTFKSVFLKPQSWSRLSTKTLFLKHYYRWQNFGLKNCRLVHRSPEMGIPWQNGGVGWSASTGAGRQGPSSTERQSVKKNEHEDFNFLGPSLESFWKPSGFEGWNLGCPGVFKKLVQRSSCSFLFLVWDDTVCQHLRPCASTCQRFYGIPRSGGPAPAHQDHLLKPF